MGQVDADALEVVLDDLEQQALDREAAEQTLRGLDDQLGRIRHVGHERLARGADRERRDVRVRVLRVVEDQH